MDTTVWRRVCDLIAPITIHTLDDSFTAVTIITHADGAVSIITDNNHRLDYFAHDYVPVEVESSPLI